THSTVDYGGGDDFDIEQLFEDGAKASPSAWSAPEEAIQQLTDGDIEPSGGAYSSSESKVSYDITEIIFGESTVAESNNTIDAVPSTPSFAENLEFKIDTSEEYEDETILPATEEKPRTIAVENIPKPREAKITPELKKPILVERASITPVLQVSRQRELLFPMLKTQKRALEITNPAEAQQVIEKLEETL
ncbi:MAG TPA: hypothetical protein PLY93_13360, partial [Turneriella sp.]|nr:hypothetical protein [Turneriella sp.]